MFTSSARIGTLMSDQGKSAEAATALGSVNVFVTDFGTLKLVPNRLQQLQTAAAAGDSAFVFILDPEYLSHSFLHGYRTDPLAKTGLAENRQNAVILAARLRYDTLSDFFLYEQRQITHQLAMIKYFKHDRAGDVVRNVADHLDLVVKMKLGQIKLEKIFFNQ